MNKRLRRQPKFMRVLGQRIGITVVAHLMHEDDGDGHQHRAYGVFDPSTPEVWLDGGNGSERAKVTLVHEALHAMLNTARIDIENEEDTVQRLSPLVLDFLRANKGLVLYLQES